MRKLKKENKESATLEELEKLLKPNIATPICGSLICLGPWGNLILRIVIKEYSDLLAPALLTFPTLIWMCIQWFLYINDKKSYKQLASDVYTEIKQNEIQFYDYTI